MLENHRMSPHKLQFRIVFRNLFAAPASAIETARPHQIKIWLNKVKLELTRERNRGQLRHYRYDMNRHIALAAARDALAMRLEKLAEK